MSPNNLDKALDVPDFIPENQLPLQKAGTTGRVFPIKLKLPNSQSFATICTADIFLELPSQRRGVHVSRISEAVQAICVIEFESPQRLAYELAKSVRESQLITSSCVNLKFVWTEFEKTPVTNLDSLQTYEIQAAAKVSGEESRLEIAVNVPSISACPCVQLNALEYYHEQNLEARSSINPEEKIPLFSHSQRVLINVRLEMYDLAAALSLDFRNLIKIVKETIPSTYDLLKRIDEVKIVEKAHLYPLFCEDIARNLGANMSKHLLGVLPEETNLIIAVSSMESIHSYNLNSELRMSIGEIKRALRLG